jgi:hypothetical protein
MQSYHNVAKLRQIRGVKNRDISPLNTSKSGEIRRVHDL